MADNSSSAMIVALVAIIVIVALAFFYFYRIMPRSSVPGTGTNVQLNIPTTSAGASSL